MKCTHCGEPLRSAAKFCPRCGHAAPGSVDLAPAPERLPASSPMPNGGKLFLAALVLIPLLIVGGFFFHKALLVLGLVFLAMLAFFFVVGTFV